MTTPPKNAFLDKSFTLRQALRWLRHLALLGLATYIALLFQNAWVIKMGGFGIGQMRYADFPKECQQIVDVHRGPGSQMLGSFGSPDSILNQITIQDRLIVRPTESLINSPSCWGYAIRAGIDAKSQAESAVSQGDFQVKFTKPDPMDLGKRITAVTVRVQYHD
jgi:hypothetical protein